ncbi:MAG: T9SS type A sorting domain-containing protein, partial [Bacteroidota bacterium]
GQLPLPTQIKDGEDEKDPTAKERWLEAMHRVEPGVSWRSIEQENERRLYSQRPRLQQRGESEIFAEGEIEGRWIERGSNNNAGCVNAMAVDTATQQLYAIGCGGTLFSSYIDGQSWQVVNPNKRFESGDLLFVNHDSTVRLLAVDHSGRVSYSDDKGQTWEDSNGLPEKQDFWGGVRNLIAEYVAEDSLMLYCLAKGGYWDELTLYASVNGGVDWNVKTLLGGPNDGSYSLAASLEKDGSYLLSNEREGSQELFRIVPDAPNELITTIDSFEMNTAHLAIAKRDTQHWIYTYDNNDALWVYKPDTIGWTQLGNFLNSPWDSGIFPHPTDTSLLLMGAVDLHVSRDGGRTWEYFSRWFDYYNDIENFIHSDIMAFEPYMDTDGNWRVLVANHGGVSISDTSFRQMKNIGLQGLNVGQFYNVASDPNDHSFVYGGTQDQGFQRGEIDATDETPIQMEQVISGDYGKVLFSGGGNRLWVPYPGSDYSYYNNPRTGYVSQWHTIESTNEPLWMPAMMPSPDPTENVIYVGGGDATGGDGAHIIRLEANVISTEITSTNLPFDFFAANNGGIITAINHSRIDTSRWYVGTDNGNFFLSENSGQTWQQTQFLPEGHYLYGAAIVPSSAEANTVYYGGSGYSGPGVYKSINGGISFETMTEGLPPTLVLDMATTPNDEFIFAATEAGPFVYSTASEKWHSLIGAETPLTNWWSVEYLEAENIVRFGTYGRGIWDLQVNSQIVSVEELVTDDALELFPNPAHQEVRISDEVMAPVRIFSLDGKLVVEEPAEARQHTIDVSRLAPGVYVVTKANARKKLVVQR